MNLWLIFLTGLTTGGISCLTVQGGLLASIISNQKEDEFKNNKINFLKTKINSQNNFLPVSMFLLAKLTSHTILGFLLGALGTVFSLSLTTRIFFQLFVAVFMFASAMNLLNVHPIFRYVSFQTPRFLRKFIHNSSKGKTFFAPIILGLLTVFVPCGITQTMEVLAINSGDPIVGALTMAAFVLGTFPLFSLIGIAAAKLSDVWRQRFLKTAAFGLIFLALYSFNGILQVIDSPFTFQKIMYAITYNPNSENIYDIKQTDSNIIIENGIQKIQIEILSNGYKPNKLTVKSGTKVELTIISNGVYSCALDFTLREFNIRETLKPTDKKIVTFTPTKKGRYTFSCSMGMYGGILEVI